MEMLALRVQTKELLNSPLAVSTNIYILYEAVIFRYSLQNVDSQKGWLHAKKISLNTTMTFNLRTCM